MQVVLCDGKVLSKLVDAIKELVSDANVDVNSKDQYISMQAMDTSHVSLVSLRLNAAGFDHASITQSFSLGVNLAALKKITSIISKDDSIVLKAVEGSDHLDFRFQPRPGKPGRTIGFALKLIDIDSEHLGIPETAYHCTLRMNSDDFQTVCAQMKSIADSCTVSVKSDQLSFAAIGDAVSVTGCSFSSGDAPVPPTEPPTEHEEKKDGNDNNGKKRKELEDAEQPQKSQKKKNAEGKEVKKEADNPNLDENGDVIPGRADIRWKEDLAVESRDLSMALALRYLVNFGKGSGLSSNVTLKLSPDLPLVVSYDLKNLDKPLGHLSFYLAPKIPEDLPPEAPADEGPPPPPS